MEDQLAVLRTAKKAMQEGLLDQADFDCVKIAFLKAQQIKAGMDAGFLREEDYLQARDSFLQSLDFSVSAAARSGGGAAHTAAAAAAAAAPKATQPSWASRSHAVSQSHPQPQAAASRQASLPLAAAAAAAPAPAAASMRASQSLASAALANNGNGKGAIPIPTDLPKLGRMGAWHGKRSMSGIGINDDTVSLFNHIKSRSAFKWVTYKIDDAGVDVVVDTIGDANASYESFVEAFPENFCRYGVFDYAYANADTQQTINKLVFINWAPDTAPTKAKMMYASTKDFFKGYLDGIGAELQANEISELTMDEMRERVHLSLTRK